MVKRLQRIDKEMAGASREAFADFIPDGDLAGFAARLPDLIKGHFAETMKVVERNMQAAG